VLDLSTDLPRAIRRIDVAMPAGDLAPAEVVLVDTPGLYTRMRIGYDSMTRDFKRVASVAVFVVKADSLFLEQVFAEFSELLQLYSRIFLVLNVDSRRMDLGPDGELVPSLEQSAPERIVRAFEELSMNARLEQAVGQGRLCIYPVDLLRAASLRLRARGGGEPGVAQDFERFRADLTSHLESNDHLNSFVADGLTRAGLLLDELEGLCAQPPVRHFIERLQRLVDQRDRQKDLLDDALALRPCAWKCELDSGPRGVLAGARRRNEIVGETLGSRLEQVLDGWFASRQSLQELVDGALTPIARHTRARLREASLDNLRSRVQGDASGLCLRDELQRRARRCGIDLGAIAREVLGEIEARPPVAVEERPLIESSQVPVRRRLVDWILLRSRDSVRRRLLGVDDSPTLAVDPARKARQLGERARGAMREAIRASHERLVDATLDELERDVRDAFAIALEERLRAAVESRLADIGRRVDDLVAAVERRRAVMLEIENLRSEVNAARWALQAIRSHCAPRLREVELQPAAPPAGRTAAELPAAERTTTEWQRS